MFIFRYDNCTEIFWKIQTPLNKPLIKKEKYRSSSKGVLQINLEAVAENYRIIRSKLVPGCEAAAVVKANAYGLGAGPVVAALAVEGCRSFFVASLDEALALRASFPAINIMILNGFYQSGADLYEQHNLVPVLGSFMEIEGYGALARHLGKTLPVFLHFNSRMNRLGLGSVEAEELFADMDMLEGLDIQGVMSHFACADEEGHPMNETQFEVFSELAAHFPDVRKSLCNSSGVFRDEKYHFDLVRPGMALYGLNPTPEKENPMRRVVSLEVPVIRTRLVYKDAVVGYGATYRFDKDTPLATVSAGYADGIFWALANKGALYFKGYRCPVRGRVSMDLTTVDVSAVPESERPRPGDYMEVLGDHQSADDLAVDAGTIGYEVLTNLGNRYERRYINDNADSAPVKASA